MTRARNLAGGHILCDPWKVYFASYRPWTLVDSAMPNFGDKARTAECISCRAMWP